MLRIGYKASAEQFTPSALLEFTCLAEAAGFDSVFISDHFQPWRHTNGHAPYSFAWMGAAGARTNRVLIGTSVVTPTFRYHPSVVAQAIGTLGSMFPDRIILGVGTGESLNEVPAIGIEWPGFKERFGRLKESITLMNRLWREERVSFEGEYYRTENATIYDRPENPVPIYVAAAGPTAATLAGKVAAGFICTSGKAPALYRETLLPNVSAGLEASGRAADSIDRMIEVKVSFDTDKQRALEDTRHWAALALSAEEKTSVEDPLEMERLADALPLERAASRWIVSNDPDEQVERIRPYVELGFRHLVFHAPGPDQARFIKLYAEQVIPKLRAAFG
ncbi:glucose-6-phosphate dehydrogenase (coenzyme-F420) [Ferrovibrio sp. MS7]|uniref:glucose-6-phosphate dehydrogenase (coenzyme-F420) n=1 Tax=Ferrovibrio plantarum TaxID=3119164 RepID=UPI0031350C0C